MTFVQKWKNHTHLTASTYGSWTNMLYRCYSLENDSFSDYGARGISVCDRWRHDYDAFVADMGLRPEGHTLERIDNNGNYGPDNCRWATPKEQNRNTRVCRYITQKGRTQTVAAWAEELDIPKATIFSRLRAGIQGQALFAPAIKLELKHGTVSKYSKGCRCEPCKLAQRTYDREKYQKRKAA